MTLTVKEIKSIVCPKDKKQIKKSDGNGLFLLVKNSGSKLWRFRYKYAGKHQEMALGKYPDIPVADVRELAKSARILLIQGINPMEDRLKNKRALTSPDKIFNKVALDWFENKKEPWGEENTTKVKRLITKDMKSLHKYPIDHIEAYHIRDVMLAVESAGTPKKAPVIKSILNRIFKYAGSHGITTNSNPVDLINLNDLLKPMPKVKHFAAIIKASTLSKFIEDIDNNVSGTFCTIEALKLIPRLFLRPKEIRFLKWEYIDFDDRIIRIPADEMKKDREHLVPLAKQVIQHLEYIKSATGYSEYVFPSALNSNKPISKNVMTNRLRELGYPGDVMSAHGFRSTASTTLNEQGWDKEAIEVQLAHLVGTPTSRAYDRSKSLAMRKKMMQAWADYLDSLVVKK
jgi:integrase